MRMKFLRSCLFLLTSLPLCVLAADSNNRLHFPTAKFSIAPLDSSPGPASHAIMMMTLLPTNNFAGNVNVQIQPYKGTIDEYLSLSLEQFKDNGIVVHAKRNIGKTAVAFDYTGKLQGQALHWYSRAEKSGDHVYLATGTATEKDWTTQGPKLKACVDSFKCD